MKTNPELVFRKEFDGTALLFNPDNGETFTLNRTAIILWEKLEQGLSEEEILAVCRKTKNFPPSGEKEIHEFLLRLKEKGFLAE